MARKGSIKPLLKCKLDNLSFLDLDTAEKCYAFGLLWADGYLSNKNALWIYLQEDDMKLLSKILKGVLPFGFYTRNLKNRKPQIGAHIHSLHLVNSLKSRFDFHKKSKKIFEAKWFANESLFRYALRGYIDGDGCFFMSNYIKNGEISPFVSTSFNICAPYDYDWYDLEIKMESLNIAFRIQKYKRMNGSLSRMVICRKMDLLKFINYIYRDGFNEIGLNRKYLKAMAIKRHIEKDARKPISKEIIDLIIKKRLQHKSFRQISREVRMPMTTVFSIVKSEA